MSLGARLVVTSMGGLSGGVAAFFVFWISGLFHDMQSSIGPACILGIVLGTFPGILVQAALIAQRDSTAPLAGKVVFLSSFIPGFLFTGMFIGVLEIGRSV
jgi:hypothetical protein